MPGSPPISTTCPAISPPPSARSNSATPVGMREASFAGMRASGTSAAAFAPPA
jgi:hypothetical protein